MIEIKKTALTEDIITQLIELSLIWEKEDISFGLRANEKEDLKEPCFIALDGNKVVGYTFGHFYESEKKTSYAALGEKCFSVDELYVLPEYRSKGIGKRLYQAIEDEVKGQCHCINLVTSTKDYKRILRFYDEEAGMVFHDAFFAKRFD